MMIGLLGLLFNARVSHLVRWRRTPGKTWMAGLTDSEVYKCIAISLNQATTAVVTTVHIPQRVALGCDWQDI